tara:strand:- start:300 stop:470 length:171 start_codon:yes stop_codon:yes gene_type:complete
MQSSSSAQKLSSTPKRCPSDISFEEHYPKENPKEAIHDVTRTLAYIGVFDGIEQQN